MFLLDFGVASTSKLALLERWWRAAIGGGKQLTQPLYLPQVAPPFDECPEEPNIEERCAVHNGHPTT